MMMMTMMTTMKVTTIFFLTLAHFCRLGLGSLTGQQSVDFDNLRMSNSDIHGTLNYHAMNSDLRPPIQPVEKLTNNIGKPLVPLPQVNLRWSSQSHTRTPPGTQRATTIAPRPQPVYQSQRQKSSQQALLSGSINSATSGGTSRSNCDWMTLRDFKNVSFQTGELIVRDEEEQPCYLLSVRGFIKWNEDSYFPLSFLQFHPRLHRYILTGRPSDGASGRSSYLNCSLLTSDGSAPSSSMRYSPLLQLVVPFKEEIIIRVKCGYLVLQIHGDGFHLTLDSLSFYQDPSMANSEDSDKLTERSRKTITKIPSKIDAEHLVFSSELTNVASPLLMIPLTSRYTCQTRVIIKGNSSVQLMLDKFELQRLAFSPSRHSELPSTNNNQSGFVPEKAALRARRQTMDGKASSHSKIPAVRRITRDAHVKVNFPSVIRCPKPTNPFDPLTMMMDLESSQGLNETLSKMIADRWMPARSSAGAAVFNPNSNQTSVFNWIFCCYILLHILLLVDCKIRTKYLLSLEE